MFLIKRIITISLTVVGSLVLIILFAVINSLANLGLTGGQVVFYGFITGIAAGVFTGYLVMNYIIRKIRKFFLSRFGNVIQKFGFLRRV